jgi:hypothetical protein
MRGRRFARVLKFVVIALVAVAVLSFVVMRLWNWVVPPVFGLHAIGYWQALALLALTRILFGGFRRGFSGFGPGMHWRRRMMERWAQMTPEEREKFRAGMGAAMGKGCSPFAQAVGETKT